MGFSFGASVRERTAAAAVRPESVVLPLPILYERGLRLPITLLLSLLVASPVSTQSVPWPVARVRPHLAYVPAGPDAWRRAYHPVRGRVVLFGGGVRSANYGDTWEFDGAHVDEARRDRAIAAERSCDG